MAFGSAIVDQGRAAPPTFRLARGQYDATREEVAPGFLTLLAPGAATISAPVGDNSTGRRTALAEWLTSADNPLPARVMVNRLWGLLFGRGICRSVEDFGAQGVAPTHPELLDWLASEYLDSGWDTKHLIKQIVMSAACFCLSISPL